jgi:excisionase family DNA binding protein
MAGRYLSLEEAAERLNLAVDEVQRLVDRKKLYPIRDGVALKFKAEDVEAFAAVLAAEPPAPAEEAAEVTADDSLTLDVEGLIDLEPVAEGPNDAAPASALFADSLALVEPLSGMKSGVIDLPLDAAPAASGLSALSASVIDIAGDDRAVPSAGADAASLIFDEEGLVDSIISASAASLVVAEEPAAAPPPEESGTLEIDLGEPFDAGGAGSLVGSLAIGSGDDLAAGSSPRSGQIGSALSGVLDSGVRIEEKALEIEGVQAWDEVDLGVPEDEDEAAAGLGGDGEDVLGDHNFELNAGGLDADDGSASVVMPQEEESEESSDFFPSSTGDSSGLSSPNFSSAGSIGSMDLPGDMISDIRFSTLQLVGLICCSLVLLIGGLVAFDLVRTIGSPRGTLLANPILDSLSQTFGWR